MNHPNLEITQNSHMWLTDAENPLTADWSTIQPFLPLLQTVRGAAVRQATVVRVCATPTHLWVRFDCADSDPWATLANHDDPIYTEEVVELFIAAGSETPKRYFELEVNPLNVRFDGIIHNPDEIRATLTLDTTWDPDWSSWVHIDPAGWSCVMSLPWPTLGASDGIGTWRLNFFRIDRPRDGTSSEESSWSPTHRDPADFHIPSRFGVLRINR